MPHVFRGSEKKEEILEPKPNRRSKIINGKRTIIFDEKSIHATPHKYIALAYTYKKNNFFTHRGKTESYNMGISLYEKTKRVIIIGKKSLEHTLDKLYDKGGYLYTFDAKDFTRMKGLGSLEVVSLKIIKPKKIEYVKNPVKEMKKLGVKFGFIDVTKE